ncbi:kinase-like protein, partial [Microstroma glucosiphilum]
MSRPRGRDDFEFGDILGEGSYSTADATLREGKRAYAIKVLDKVHILKERKQKYVAVEKEALSLLVRHPGVIRLYWTFQDQESLYFVLELAPNGELLTFIKKYGSFDENTTRYYAAQLLDAISGMHAAGVIHRDVKPENVLLDDQMNVKVTDFGSAKIVNKADNNAASGNAAGPPRANSFVGTAEYVSPELLTDKAASKASDFWAFGCVVFQMLAGRPPFKAISEYQTFQKIIKREFEMPSELSEEATDLLNNLLVLEPDQRLREDQIRSHPFFKGVDWDALWQTEAPAMKTGIRAAPPPKEPR